MMKLRRLLALREDTLTRERSHDQRYAIGVGLSRSADAVWDEVTQRYLLLGFDRAQARLEVASLSRSLHDLRVLFPIPGSLALGLTNGPDQTLATCRLPDPAIDTYSRNGSAGPSIDLTTIAGLPPRRCATLAYLSSIDAYAIAVPGRAYRQTVFVVSRTGAPLRCERPGGGSELEDVACSPSGRR